MQAVDYSFSRPAPADLAAAGYVGALRYLCSLPNAKAITGDEVASLHANGLAVALVFEDGVANALAGSAQGTTDGRKARAQADDLGFPMDRPIYAAVDTDAQSFQFDTIEAYLRAFTTEIGRPVGVYGSWFVIEAMLDRGAATFAWQTAAWSHGKRSDRAQLYQRIGGAPSGCDVNDVLVDDWGQWPAPNDTPPEDDMGNAKGPFMVRFGTDGNVYCVQSDGYFHVVDEAHRDRMKLYGLVQTDDTWENGCVQVHPEHERADILFGRPLDA